MTRKRRFNSRFRYVSYVTRTLILLMFIFIINGSISGFKIGTYSIITPPEGFIYIFLSPGYSALKIILYIIPWIIATVIMGRIFCGYICPVGLLIDIGTFIREKKIKRKLLYRKNLHVNGNYIAYIGGGFFIAILTLNGILHSQFLNWLVSPFADFIKVIYTFPYISVELIFIVLIISLSIWYPRLWCRAFCPAGFIFTVLSMINKKRLLTFTIDGKKCNECGICGLVCPLGICPLDNSPACTYCLECYDRCPVKALKLSFFSSTRILSDENELIS